MKQIDKYLSKDLQEVIEAAVVRTYKSVKNDGAPAQKEITFEAYGMKLRMMVYFKYYENDVNKDMGCCVDIWRKGAMDINNQTGSEYRYGHIETFVFVDQTLRKYIDMVEAAVVTTIAKQMKADVEWIMEVF